MSIKIALAGNPNSGKTTLFNDLTGASQYVGNWPGVTVEKKEGKLRGQKEVIITDLPGIYSLSPYTLEEVVTRDYLINESPSAIINIVDASNIERNLYLTTQLVEMGIPVIVALNMMDIVRKNGETIHTDKLAKELGCQVVEISALKGENTKELAEQAVKLAKSGNKTTPQHTFGKDVEAALSQIEVMLEGSVEASQKRWFAIKLFERDSKVLEAKDLSRTMRSKLETVIEGVEKTMDDDSESIITNERYEYIGKVISDCVIKKRGQMTSSDKIDNIVTNRFLALPIFVVIMFLVYFLSISTIGTAMTDWVNEELFEEMIPGAVEGFLDSVGTAEWLNSLILDGIIAGVGAVLGFLPQMLVLFFCLAILEDCGYMARVAFIMDRIFRKFGLSGKSFIPMLVSSGCAVPGIMASRTIENEPDRKMTVMTTAFIPCGAKLPIIALIAGAMFPGSIWVAPSAYFIGIGAIIVSGIMLKKTRPFAGEPAPFVMELPQYHMPGAKGILIHMWDRGKAFVKKAGTIILLASVIIWFLQSFSFSMEMVEDAEDSILAAIGGVVAPLFSPLGWGDWRAAVASVTGLVAKENVVGTMAVLYAGLEEVSEEGEEIWHLLGGYFTQLSAYSFLVFNLLCAPCFAAIGAMKKEMGTVKWTLISVGYMTGFAYVVALIIFQFGMLFTGGGFSFGTVLAVICLAVILFLLFRPAKDYTGAKLKAPKDSMDVSA